MNKAQLVEAVQGALGTDASKRQAEDAVGAVLDSIVKGVKQDQKVQIIGFGTFEVKKREARMGRNPKTGEEVPISPRRVLSFRPSHLMKDRVAAGNKD